jgi:hypothetical protein
MTSLTAIGVDNKENVVPNPTDRLDSDLPIRDDRPVSSGTSPGWTGGSRFDLAIKSLLVSDSP